MKIDILKELCNKFTVEVSFNGFQPFTHKVIDANKLLENIHEVVSDEVSKEDFIKNINSGNFMTKEIEDIFRNIKSQGTFKIHGHEKLGNHSYIECEKLIWL
jgi:heme oxygenase